MLKHSIPIRKFLFPTFRLIPEALRVGQRNSMRRFASTQRRALQLKVITRFYKYIFLIRTSTSWDYRVQLIKRFTFIILVYTILTSKYVVLVLIAKTKMPLVEMELTTFHTDTFTNKCFLKLNYIKLYGEPLLSYTLLFSLLQLLLLLKFQVKRRTIKRHASWSYKRWSTTPNRGRVRTCRTRTWRARWPTTTRRGPPTPCPLPRWPRWQLEHATQLRWGSD